MRHRPFESLISVASIALLACGCGSEVPVQPQVVAQEAEETVVEAQTPAGPAIEDPRFDLRLLAEGPFVSGQAGAVRVRLEGRGEYEVESRYPYRLVFRPSDGLAISRRELERRDATEISADRATFDVDVTPARAGNFNCEVEVEFAVCSESGCVPLTRTLSVTLSAS